MGPSSPTTWTRTMRTETSKKISDFIAGLYEDPEVRTPLNDLWIACGKPLTKVLFAVELAKAGIAFGYDTRSRDCALGVSLEPDKRAPVSEFVAGLHRDPRSMVSVSDLRAAFGSNAKRPLAFTIDLAKAGLKLGLSNGQMVAVGVSLGPSVELDVVDGKVVKRKPKTI